MGVKPVTLGGYPAKKCARRTHNTFAPGLPAPLPISPDVQARLDAGLVFESSVVDELQHCYRDSSALLVLGDDDGWSANQDRTRAAISDGVPVIVNGRLPDVNGRVGAPDVLVRCGHGYLPVDIKGHKTLKPSANPDSPKARAQVTFSTLETPDDLRHRRGYSNKVVHRIDDALQLAHYTRMLQDLGCAATEHLGGIIGTSDFAPLIGRRYGITWYDLDIEDILTYSATGPKHRRKRSALQRYDHEFAFRIKVARAAQAGDELVRPYRTTECANCEWLEYCTAVVGSGDASFAIEAGLLDVREWQHLYTRCGRGGELAVAQLAEAEPADHRDDFRDQSVHNQADKRLADVIKRARMTVAGVDFEPHGGRVPLVPAADIEVDFDIEWDYAGRIYQWGLRIRDGQDDNTARYEPVVSFAELDEAGEAELAREFAARVRRLRAEAERSGKSLRIFHWSHPETSHTRRFPDVVEAIDGLTEDLMTWFNKNYFARTSSSIKSVATRFGFRWDVEDAGGAASQRMIDIARGGGPDAASARRWCLRYNECDVIAQAVIRDGLRADAAGKEQQ